MHKLLILPFIFVLTACQNWQQAEAPSEEITKEDIFILQASFNEQLSLQQAQQQAANEKQNELNRQLARQQQQFNKFNLALTQLTDKLVNAGLVTTNNLNAANPASQAVTHNDKLVLGQTEYLGLVQQRLTLPARVDTGAKTSSLHATDIKNFERDGQTWVRFTSSYDDKQGEVKTTRLEAPLVRKVIIKQAMGEEERPVISLEILLGNLSQTTEFTLTDRTNLQFPLLLGRAFFMDIGLVDVSQSYVQGLPQFPEQEPTPEEPAKDTPQLEIDELKINKLEASNAKPENPSAAN